MNKILLILLVFSLTLSSCELLDFSNLNSNKDNLIYQFGVDLNTIQTSFSDSENEIHENSINFNILNFEDKVYIDEKHIWNFKINNKIYRSINEYFTGKLFFSGYDSNFIIIETNPVEFNINSPLSKESMESTYLDVPILFSLPSHLKQSAQTIRMDYYLNFNSEYSLNICYLEKEAQRKEASCSLQNQLFSDKEFPVYIESLAYSLSENNETLLFLIKSNSNYLILNKDQFDNYKSPHKIDLFDFNVVDYVIKDSIGNDICSGNVTLYNNQAYISCPLTRSEGNKFYQKTLNVKFDYVINQFFLSDLIIKKDDLS